MNRMMLIKKCYKEFGKFPKPEKVTVYDDSPIDQDHEKSMSGIKRRDLSIEIIGPSTWSPISYLNKEAIAYYMPRLIEFALLNEEDLDGEPFQNRFINDFYLGPQSNDNRFDLFQTIHKDLMQEVFVYIKKNFMNELVFEGWKDEVDLAIQNWAS